MKGSLRNSPRGAIGWMTVLIWAVDITPQFYSLSRGREPLRLGRHLGRSFQLVPVEGASIDSPLHRLEEHQRKELTIRKPLQPDVEQQPPVAFVRRVPPLQAEGQGRSDEVDDQKGQEEGQQLLEVRGIGRLRMEVAVKQVVHHARDKHQVNKRRDQRQQDLEDQDIGQGKQSHRLVLEKRSLVLVHRLQRAEGPAEPLPHQPARPSSALR